MKLKILCPLCEKDRTNEDILRPELADDNVYELVCPEGHEFAMILWKLRFELLIDFGIKAFQDGYYRESLANMATALERFYEFYIHVICLKHGINEKTIKEAWSEVSSQSERQLGAFLFLYLLENSQPIIPLKNDLVKLRNGVTHKGKIPSRRDAILFGERVMEVISTMLVKLQENDQAWINRAITMMCALKKGRIEGVKTSAMIYEGVINVTMSDDKISPVTFEQAVENFHEAMGQIFEP